MSTQVAPYDVFLSYSLTDAATAELVSRSLVEAGLDVVDVAKTVRPGEDFAEEIRKALAKSDAIVVVVDPSRSLPSSVAVEVGAATAWNKPVFAVHTQSRNVKLPIHIAGLSAYPLSRIDELVHLIRQSIHPLSDSERDCLRTVYLEIGLSVDAMLLQPSAIDELAARFEQATGRRVAGERLVQELMRMRKGGSPLRRLRR